MRWRENFARGWQEHRLDFSILETCTQKDKVFMRTLIISTGALTIIDACVHCANPYSHTNFRMWSFLTKELLKRKVRERNKNKNVFTVGFFMLYICKVNHLHANTLTHDSIPFAGIKQSLHFCVCAYCSGQYFST